MSGGAISKSIHAGAASAIALVVSAPAQGQQVERAYDLPAQPLGDALRAVAMASGTNIIAATLLVRGKTAPALSGRYTPANAVLLLLQGSGLRARQSGTSLIIERDAATQDHVEAARNGDDAEILVTGSRIRGAPVASTVIAIGQEEMRNSGQTNLGDVVRSIPQSFGGGQNPGIGINVPSASGVDVSGASSINLRGLGSDATLTLLNGHRLAYNASRQSVDVSAIPIGAVSRIEIVPDGASALYGSDAVAGVANILLKRDFDGIELGARLASATDGGAFQQQYTATAGTTWARGGVIAAYEYGDSTAILSDQRSYARETARGLTLFPPLRHHSAILSGHQGLTEQLRFEFDGLFNKRWSEQRFPLNTAGDPDISRAKFFSKDVAYGVAPSLKLDLGTWRATLTGTFGQERVDYGQIECRLDECAPTGAGYYLNKERSAQLGGDGSLFELPGGAAKLALGLGYRKIAFKRDNGPGSTVNTAQAQDSYFAFGELSLPLVGAARAMPFLQRLNLSAALRYERYPGIGEVVTPKVGIIASPTPDFDVKGSWGKSFRAPTLYQQYQPRSVYVYPPGPLGGSGLPASATTLLVLGGNPELKPERATTWSATLVIHPRALPGARLEVSYFDVVYKERIVTPITFLSQALSNPTYTDQVSFNPSPADQQAVIASAAYFANFTAAPYNPANVVAIIDNGNVNAGRQVARGVDILADYIVAAGRSGQVRFALNASYLDSEQQLSASQPITPLAGLIFNPPHWRGRATISWATGPATLTGNLNYIGGVEDVRRTPAARVRSMATFDLTGRYGILRGEGPLDGLELTVSAHNLFNAKPDPIRVTLAYETPYDSTNYSPVGRLLSIGINKKW